MTCRAKVFSYNYENIISQENVPTQEVYNGSREAGIFRIRIDGKPPFMHIHRKDRWTLLAKYVFPDCDGQHRIIFYELRGKSITHSVFLLLDKGANTDVVQPDTKILNL